MNKDDGNGTMTGTGRSDELLGGHDSDTSTAMAGRTSCGVIQALRSGPAQVDRLFGGDGSDFIYAGHGQNTIVAGNGNDTVHAHFGRGSIDCGAGRDTLFISHRSRPGYRLTHCEHISFRLSATDRPDAPRRRDGADIVVEATIS